VDALALVKEVGAERHDPLAGIDAGDDGSLLGEPANLHGPERYRRRVEIDDPHAGGLAVVIKRASGTSTASVVPPVASVTVTVAPSGACDASPSRT
jgi:hypothetical protein